MKNLLIAAAAGTAVAHQSFNEWTLTHRRNYATAEERQLRAQIYEENVAHIKAHNAKGLPWTLGVNAFTDLTNAEFRARYTGGVLTRADPAEEQIERLSADALPDSIDWVAKGAVTDVKNQGSCGSCWSFSTTGSIEGINFIKTGKLVALSEQQLIDCSTAFGNAGCHGGLMDQAMKYVSQSAGLCSETEYPYQDVSFTDDGQANPGEFTCQAKGPGSDPSSPCAPQATISGYSYVTPNDTNAMVAALAQQPVSIAVDAGGLDWQFYFGGVLSDLNCGLQLDHGVLAVGYGPAINGTAAFFKVKNSWGAGWGEQGYIRLARGGDVPPPGICGMLMQPVYPTKD